MYVMGSAYTCQALCSVKSTNLQISESTVFPERNVSLRLKQCIRLQRSSKTLSREYGSRKVVLISCRNRHPVNIQGSIQGEGSTVTGQRELKEGFTVQSATFSAETCSISTSSEVGQEVSTPDTANSAQHPLRSRPAEDNKSESLLISHVDILRPASLRRVRLPQEEVKMRKIKQNVHNKERERSKTLTLQEVVAFTVPALGALLADPLMSLVDTACVGQYSAVHLGALGPNTAIFGFVNQIFSFFTTATTGLVAQHLSRGSNIKAGVYVSNAMLIAVALGIITSCALCAFDSQIFHQLGTGDEILGPAVTYLRIRAWAIPALLLSTVGTASCLGQRDSRTPLLMACFASVFNLFGNFYLVLGPPQWGIKGAAYATVAAQYFSAVGFLAVLWRRPTAPIRLSFPKWNDVVPFFSTSSLVMLRSLALIVSISILTRAAASAGTISIAAHQVVVGIFTLCQFVPEPISQFAQSYLAKDTPASTSSELRIWAENMLLKCAAAVGSAMFLVSFFPAIMPSLFTNDVLVITQIRSVSVLVATAAGLLSMVCVTDGLLLAKRDLSFCVITQVFNLAVLGAYMSMIQFTYPGLLGVWSGMVVLQSLRFVQNICRLRWHNYYGKESPLKVSRSNELSLYNV